MKMETKMESSSSSSSFTGLVGKRVTKPVESTDNTSEELQQEPQVRMETSNMHHRNSGRQGGISKDHRQTMTSATVTEEKFSVQRHTTSKITDDRIPRKRDLLHGGGNLGESHKSNSVPSQIVSCSNKTNDEQYELFSQKYPYNNGEELSGRHQNINGKGGEPFVHCMIRPVPSKSITSNSSRTSKTRRKSCSSSCSSRIITPTGGAVTEKPPLKPHRSSRHSRSVSTRSTSSATYVSSDSSDGGGRKANDDDDDDDSIEAPDIRIRVYDGNQSNNGSQSSSLSLAQYESADDTNSSRFAIVPYMEEKSCKKKKKQRNSRAAAVSSSAASKKKNQPLQTLAFSSDDEDLDPFGQLYLSSSDTGSISEESVVDLDQMIAETSARWKNTVGAIVTSTVTASTFNNADAISLKHCHNVNTQPTVAPPSAAVAGLSPINCIPFVHEQNQPIPMPTLRSSGNTLSTRTVSYNTSTYPTTTAFATPRTNNDLIEQQQAEIEALRAALKTKQQSPSSNSNPLHLQTMYVNVSCPDILVVKPEGHTPSASKSLMKNDKKVKNTSCQDLVPFAGEKGDSISIDCVPVEHIEVNHNASDPNSYLYWQDDLTVWSGFNTVTGEIDSVGRQNNNHNIKSSSEKVATSTSTKAAARTRASKSDISEKPEINKRPDAESTTGASALEGIPTRVVTDMKVDLTSGITSGIIRKALYSGTINAQTRLPEGQGVFKFIETGDLYKGEVHAGEMHGAGTYIFGTNHRVATSSAAPKMNTNCSSNHHHRSRSSSSSSKGATNRPKELKGTFERNVFIG